MNDCRAHHTTCLIVRMHYRVQMSCIVFMIIVFGYDVNIVSEVCIDV